MNKTPEDLEALRIIARRAAVRALGQGFGPVFCAEHAACIALSVFSDMPGAPTNDQAAAIGAATSRVLTALR